jgi:hypothetical protein
MVQEYIRLTRQKRYRSNISFGGPAYAVRCHLQLTHGYMQQIASVDDTACKRCVATPMAYA